MPRGREGGGAALQRLQERALRSTMRIVRELGPVAFLLREEGRAGAPLRVRPRARCGRAPGAARRRAGSAAVLSSAGGPGPASLVQLRRLPQGAGPLQAPLLVSAARPGPAGGACRAWRHHPAILLKKYRLPRDHEYVFKKGLLEREIEDVLQRLQQEQTLSPEQTAFSPTLNEENEILFIHQKEIGIDDVCPICQEELLKMMLPITFCRYSCGNNVHIKCMKIWADHQDELGPDSVVKCPLCREEFAPLKLIQEEFRNSSQLITAAERARLDRHLGIPCNNCRVFPIVGKCYKCTECIEYHLCHECFIGFCHSPHLFVFRQKRNMTWRSLNQFSELSSKGENFKSFNPGNNSKEPVLHPQEKTSCTPKRIVKSLPNILVGKQSHLLAPGIQCRCCLKPFLCGQHVRHLPCNHKFHRECIDSWLLHRKNTCPIDDYVVYNPLTWKAMPAKHDICLTASHRNVSKLSEQVEPEIFVSGNGLFLKQTLSGPTSESPQSCFKKLYNKNVPLSSSSFDTSFCSRTNIISSRKDDIYDAERPRQFDCSNTNRVVPFKKGKDSDKSTILNYPRELNLEINLGAASQYSTKDSKDVRNANHQSRLLTRLPHLNIKAAKMDLLLEGIQLHTNS
ncbi:E3 ubiquitin-protein ligase ZSWIM2 [Eudromia elegans]